jgi:hypothetical protein
VGAGRLIAVPIDTARAVEGGKYGRQIPEIDQQARVAETDGDREVEPAEAGSRFREAVEEQEAVTADRNQQAVSLEP